MTFPLGPKVVSQYLPGRISRVEPIGKLEKTPTEFSRNANRSVPLRTFGLF